MKLYEYQAKQLFREYGIPVLAGEVAGDERAAAEIAARLGRAVVVKAQVPVGGRGKAGGIRLAATKEEAATTAREILGMQIRGFPVYKVLVEEAGDVASEYYAAIIVDRAGRAPVAILSSAGGMDVEEIARTCPEKMARLRIDTGVGLRPFHVRGLAASCGFPFAMVRELTSVLSSLYRLFWDKDASLAEINPLSKLSDGRLVALDGKVETDDSALFRHPELGSAPSDGTEHPLEMEARERGFSYVKLQGDVGIIGNGAGLVMATLDMVQRQGGKAANFLDIGGGARAEVVKAALEVVRSDPDVKSVLINVFGGITRCDEVASGLLQALEMMGTRPVPIVVRLAGTREQEGRELLEKGGLMPMPSFAEAAHRAVLLAASGPNGSQTAGMEGLPA
ncbi:MAG: ADP-forming succinate--CoA ligase subunit beta [Firmicutes bacterium]|nr:ADP-forming succinate--CoA ligase subunit beta [Bacillota bacterium]